MDGLWKLTPTLCLVVVIGKKRTYSTYYGDRKTMVVSMKITLEITSNLEAIHTKIHLAPIETVIWNNQGD